METHKYRFNGVIYTLTSDEYKQFNNNDLTHSVSLGNPYIFKLKNGGQIEGTPVNIKCLKSESSFDDPLQAEFEIIPLDQKDSVSLNFTQIEDHELTFIPRPLFK